MVDEETPNPLTRLYEQKLDFAKKILTTDDNDKFARMQYRNIYLLDEFNEAAKLAFEVGFDADCLWFAMAAKHCTQTKAGESSAQRFIGQMAVDVVNTYGVESQNADLLITAVFEYTEMRIDHSSQPSREAILTVFEKALVQLREDGANPEKQIKEFEKMKLPKDMMARAKSALLNIKLSR